MQKKVLWYCAGIAFVAMTFGIGSASGQEAVASGYVSGVDLSTDTGYTLSTRGRFEVADTITVTGYRRYRPSDSRYQRGGPETIEDRSSGQTTITYRRQMFGSLGTQVEATSPSTERYHGPNFDNDHPRAALVFPTPLFGGADY